MSDQAFLELNQNGIELIGDNFGNDVSIFESGIADFKSLKINGTEVIDSSRVLKNVSGAGGWDGTATSDLNMSSNNITGVNSLSMTGNFLSIGNIVHTGAIAEFNNGVLVHDTISLGTTGDISFDSNNVNMISTGDFNITAAGNDIIRLNTSGSSGKTQVDNLLADDISCTNIQGAYLNMEHSNTDTSLSNGNFMRGTLNNQQSTGGTLTGIAYHQNVSNKSLYSGVVSERENTGTDEYGLKLVTCNGTSSSSAMDINSDNSILCRGVLQIGNMINMIWCQLDVNTNQTTSHSLIDWTLDSQSGHNVFSVSADKHFINVNRAGYYHISISITFQGTSDERGCNVNFRENGTTRRTFITCNPFLDGSTSYATGSMQFIHYLTTTANQYSVYWETVGDGTSDLRGIDGNSMMTIIQVG